MRKGFVTLMLALCCAWMVSAPVTADAADKIVIRFAHSNTPTDMDPYHALVTKMQDKLAQKLGADRVEIQEFPAGQIGSEERSFQDVQQGILQMTVLAVNNASIFAPSLGAFDLPYIFKNVKEFDDCVEQNWDLINKRMEAESGTVAIAWHSQGFRFITNSKQPVTTLKDLAPVKIRTPNNPIMIGVYRAWGTAPVPMAMDETFNALQQKVVDGQDNPSSPSPPTASMKSRSTSPNPTTSCGPAPWWSAPNGCAPCPKTCRRPSSKPDAKRPWKCAICSTSRKRPPAPSSRKRAWSSAACPRTRTNG